MLETEPGMDLSDDLGNEIKKVERENHKTELERQVRTLGLGIDRAGHEASEEIKKTQDTAAPEENKAE